MTGALAIAVLVPSSMVAGGATPLPAQTRPRLILRPTPLLAHAIQDLSFGTLLPGIPTSVAPLDARHAGKFEVRGPVDLAVRVEFVLPATLDLVGPGAATVPLSYGPADGFAGFHQAPPVGTVFDPRLPLITTLGPDGVLFINLGATALAALGQTGGSYAATIFMTVYSLGS